MSGLLSGTSIMVEKFSSTLSLHTKAMMRTFDDFPVGSLNKQLNKNKTDQGN